MRRSLIAAVALLALPLAARAAEPKTFFDYLETSFVFGQLHVAKPLPFRDGTILVFATKVTDVVHARIGKPQQLMLVQELKSKDEKPPFNGGDSFVAAVALLPPYSYWRDNLPATPHHQLLGGARYLFTSQADMEEAKRIAKPFADTLTRERAERWPDQSDAVVTGLTSSIAVLREDSSRYLASHPVLLQRMPPAAIERLGAYLGSDAPEPDRLRVMAAIAPARATDLLPVLEPLAKRDDATGAAALGAQDGLGKSPATAKLLELCGAKSEAVRAYAAEALGTRAVGDRDALAKASGILASNEPASVRAAAAVGLGNSRAPEALAPLRAAMDKNDAVTRPAAAAIAAIGGTDAAQILKTAVVEGKGEAQTAAIVAMVNAQGPCPGCREFLAAQYTANPDKNVRDLIGIMLEFNKKHEH